MTRPNYHLPHVNPSAAPSGARRLRLWLTAAAVLAGALILPLTGALVAPAAQALPVVPSPGDFATWHRVDVMSRAPGPGS